MTTPLIIIACYLASALPFIGLARILDDPYGHFTPRQDWTQAILLGLFYPFVLGYIVFLLLFRR